jgi:hypothetical protein
MFDHYKMKMVLLPKIKLKKKKGGEGKEKKSIRHRPFHAQSQYNPSKAIGGLGVEQNTQREQK